uniref:Variant surface glycoprotein 1125.5106 n=1 Tax=Trypanosoma brucei TaxID=5691 RepID=A0A1J0RBT4_9TRYP|nr:variant surface glycoprotein 1125.5106 [Trypanosoma brucei]
MMCFCTFGSQVAEDPAAAAIKTPYEADIYLDAVADQLSKRLKFSGAAAARLTDQARKLQLEAVAPKTRQKAVCLEPSPQRRHARRGKFIWKQTIGTDLKYDNAGNAATAFQKLQEKCPVHSKLKATTAALRHAIASFVGALKGSGKATQASNTILGYGNAATCDGGANPDCVLYKTPEDGQGLNVPWLTHLATAAEMLETINTEQEHNKQLLDSARALATAVLSSYIQAEKPRPDPVSEQSMTDRSGGPTPTSICAAHTNKEDCKPPCKWADNATDKTKKCSLDPQKAAEQQATQAGTGEGAAGAAATGCAKHKDNKDKCNKLESQGCVFGLKEFEGKRCTLSEKGKQKVEKEAEKLEDDEKTNTTWSNSVVIKKAPLLLL